MMMSPGAKLHIDTGIRKLNELDEMIKEILSLIEEGKVVRAHFRLGQAQSKLRDAIHDVKETRRIEAGPPEKTAASGSGFAIAWTETEAGWGQRPDGFSLHRTPEEAKAFVKKYWDGMPDGPAPSEYSFPEGEPFPIVYDTNVIASIGPSGIRTLGRNLPEGVRRA